MLPRPLQTVLGVILGGGAGSRLYPLTKKRAKPAVPLGANYRLIDIPVSNCINSNVNKIYCLTQFNSASLNRHLSQAYVSAPAPGSAIHCVPVGAGSALLRLSFADSLFCSFNSLNGHALLGLCAWPERCGGGHVCSPACCLDIAGNALHWHGALNATVPVLLGLLPAHAHAHLSALHFPLHVEHHGDNAAHHSSPGACVFPSQQWG